MRFLIALYTLIFSLLLFHAKAQQTPDSLGAVTEVKFGIKLHDPFRGFEDMENASVQKWMSWKNKQAKQTLASVPGYQELQTEIKKLTSSSNVRAKVPKVTQDYIYVLQSVSVTNSDQIVRYQNPLGQGEVVFSTKDLNRQDSTTYGVYSFYPSPDNRYLALQMDKDGNDWMEIYVYDIEKKRITDRIDATMSFFPSWIDSNSLFYTQINLTDDPNKFFSNIKVKYHRLGTDQAKDKIFLSQETGSGIEYQAGDFPSFTVLPGGEYIHCGIARGVSPYPIAYIAPLEQVLKGNGSAEWQLVYDFDDQISQDAADNEYFYMMDDEAGEILKAPLAKPKKFSTILSSPKKGFLRDMKVTSKSVYAEIVQDGISSLWDVNNNQQVPIPFKGNIKLHEPGSSAISDGDHLLFGLANWSHGYGIYYFDSEKNKVIRTDMRPAGPYDMPGHLVVEEVNVRAKNGEEIPLSIIHDNSITKDGNNPTIIEVYGAYGNSLEPYFSVEMLPWYENGGILAVAHVRGGGEKGVDWHKAGMKENKPNSWNDLISSAQYLIDNGYSRPEKLGVMGGSAGGIAVGSAITEQPELFSAAMLEFPLLNTTRIDQQPGGYVQSEEFGSPEDSTEFSYLYEMDVYHHIQKGTSYPALLFTAGKNDQRTLAWEPAKVAAKFETRRGNDEPTLFRLYEGGHGSGTVEEAVEMLSDKFAFFSWKLGLKHSNGPSNVSGQE